MNEISIVIITEIVVVWRTCVLFPIALSLVFIWPNELQADNSKEPSGTQ